MIKIRFRGNLDEDTPHGPLKAENFICSIVSDREFVFAFNNIQIQVLNLLGF